VKRSRIIITVLALAVIPLAGAEGGCDTNDDGSPKSPARSFSDGRHYPGVDVARGRYVSHPLYLGETCTVTLWAKRGQIGHSVTRGDRKGAIVAIDLRSKRVVQVVTEGCGTFRI
jgi:hypothetical protein